ncbi:Transcription regulator,histidine kinase sensor-like protein [Pseudodesulfovibrio mercurii]|uniref:Transcription regulator,histidine kinase sensor-like protein n=1 Tax=Pseudodesulfovibrio mercurii TaxID=641491 RepID=F0JFK5_9BACT|nr:PocR ligand-binding domain-containing protein [Pseudodesulfovibrio mercurii]EGB14929.1 Transcription regulator,histidine kinase sensor-like protein [Pseudodesulfovibrio mercurii]
MTLKDLVPEEELVRLQQDLHDRFGLNADIMDGEGHRLFGSTWGNDLCRAIRDDDKGFSAICATAGQMFTQLLKEGEPFVEYCDAGMVRVGVPVVVDGEVIGGVGGCGLVPADEEVDEFAIGMMSGLSEDAIAAKAQTVKPADEARLAEIQAFIAERLKQYLP